MTSGAREHAWDALQTPFCMLTHEPWTNIGRWPKSMRIAKIAMLGMLCRLVVDEYEGVEAGDPKRAP